jgi:hypothetical protein
MAMPFEEVAASNVAGITVATARRVWQPPGKFPVKQGIFKNNREF